MGRRPARRECKHGKVVFTSFKAAQHAGRKMPLPGRPYWCPEGGGYHLTHLEKAEYSRRIGATDLMNEGARVLKIPTLFYRDSTTFRVVDKVREECAWVLTGEGRATRKYDGVCMMFDGQWWVRRDVKAGRGTPRGFTLVDTRTDGSIVGWEPLANTNWGTFLAEALADTQTVRVGSYELCGPRVVGNPEAFGSHVLLRHGEDVLADVPTEFDKLSGWLRGHAYEGVVWHHPSGRMAKVKRSDFGMRGPR